MYLLGLVFAAQRSIVKRVLRLLGLTTNKVRYEPFHTLQIKNAASIS